MEASFSFAIATHLDISYLYYCLPALLVSLLWSAGFAVFYFRFLKSKTFSKYINNQKRKFVFLVLYGLGLSSIFFVLYAINLALRLDAYYLPILGASVCLVFAYFISTITLLSGFASLFSSLTLFYVFSDKVNTGGLLFIFFFYVIIMITVYIARRITKQNTRIVMIASFSCHIIALIFILIFLPESEWTLFITDISISFMFSLLLSFSIYWFLRVSTRLVSLSKKAIYEDEYFLNHRLILNEFNRNITTQKIDNAFIFIFKFSGLDNIIIKYGQSTLDKIKSYILDNIHDYFSDTNCMLFKTEDNNYGIILFNADKVLNLKKIYDGNKLNLRKNNDPLREMEIIVNALPTSIKRKNTQTEILVQAIGTIYNVQSCNVMELIKYTESAANLTIIPKNHSRINVQQFFPDDISNSGDEQFFKMKKEFDPLKISVVLEKISNSFYAPYFIEYNTFSSVAQDYEKRMSPQAFITLQKHLAIRTLDLYSQIDDDKKKLLLFYPVHDFLIDSFQPLILKKKIDSYDIKYKKIIFVIDVDLQSMYGYVFKKNVESLKNIGFEICFKMDSASYISKINDITPDYISFNKNISENKKIMNELKIYCDLLKVKII